jgi:hypothetical protein
VRGNDQHLVEQQCFARGLGRIEMADVDWIERAAEQAETRRRRGSLLARDGRDIAALVAVLNCRSYGRDFTPRCFEQRIDAFAGHA